MIACHLRYRSWPKVLASHNVQRQISSTSPLRILHVKQLTDWNLENFQQHAFDINTPARLPATRSTLPPACQKWFIHDEDAQYTIDLAHSPQSSELQPLFWSDYESTLVPLELTTKDPITNKPTFTRSPAPLKILLSYLNQSLSHTHSIYLAQCSLDTLPPALQQDLPTPNLVLKAGKGDIYSSSLWLGRPPTYTPLHRDPNPNILLQLAGKKLVRLLPPEVGDAVFDDIQEQLQSRGSARLRGEEMMAGEERELLHDVLWEGDNTGVLNYGLEAELGLGEALFIPKGWWHSVKGIGSGVTASANWWFR